MVALVLPLGISIKVGQEVQRDILLLLLLHEGLVLALLARLRQVVDLLVRAPVAAERVLHELHLVVSQHGAGVDEVLPEHVFVPVGL